MPRYLFWSLAALACVPLALVALLLLAAHFPAMDHLTMAMPDGVRQSVAALAMGSAGYGKESLPKVDRVVRLDPENAAGLSRRCELDDEDKPSAKLMDCQKALRFDRSERNLNGLGLAQEHLQDYCAAEDSFTQANFRVNAAEEYILRNLGRTALQCGHSAAAVSSLEVAEEHDEKDLANGEDNADDLTLDREWLVIAYNANHDTKAATLVCSRAHPGWKSCDCSVDGGEVKCSDNK